MDILARIKEVLEAEPNEAQLDKFLHDVRDSLAASNKQFIAYPLLAIAALVMYHLVNYEGASGLAFNSLQVSDTKLFRKLFLVVPAALLVAGAGVGYLRRIQREVYDYLTISRYRPLAQTGLHELRLPPDYLLGLFLLNIEGGAVGKVVVAIVMFLETLVFIAGPAVYVVVAAAHNFAVFGIGDALSTLFGAIAMTLSVCSLAVIALAGCIKAK